MNFDLCYFDPCIFTVNVAREINVIPFSKIVFRLWYKTFQLTVEGRSSQRPPPH